MPTLIPFYYHVILRTLKGVRSKIDLYDHSTILIQDRNLAENQQHHNLFISLLIPLQNTLPKPVILHFHQKVLLPNTKSISYVYKKVIP